jgi:hypothetical protein
MLTKHQELIEHLKGHTTRSTDRLGDRPGRIQYQRQGLQSSRQLRQIF